MHHALLYIYDSDDQNTLVSSLRHFSKGMVHGFLAFVSLAVCMAGKHIYFEICVATSGYDSFLTFLCAPSQDTSPLILFLVRPWLHIPPTSLKQIQLQSSPFLPSSYKLSFLREIHLQCLP